MTKNVYAIGFVTFIVMMIAFFITNIFFRDVNYYRTTIILSSFLAPLVYAIGAFISVTSYSKFKKVLNFKEAYGRAFMPMFVGGFLTIASIFAYINYFDTATKDLLNYQYIESFKTSLEEEYTKATKVLKPDSEEMKEVEEKYKVSKIRIAEKEKSKDDMFTAKYFSYVFAGYCAFFIILSLFFGSFFRTRRTELEMAEEQKK